jgi:hypothetical protein
MSEPIDHRSIARQILTAMADADAPEPPMDLQPITAAVSALAFATLALSDQPPVQFQVADAADVDLSTAARLNELIESVRALLRNRIDHTPVTETFNVPVAVVDKLRELTS